MTFCDEFARRRNFPALDGLRGVSVLLVLTWHVRNGRFDWLNGVNGVRVFFVLSGFLITTLCLREESDRGRVSLRAFFVRRATRILPLYVIALASYTALVLVFHLDDREQVFRSALPYYAFFLQEVPLFQNIDRPFGVSWSLGIEEKFYVVWPILAFAAARTFRLRIGAVLALGGLFFIAGVEWSAGRYVSPYTDILIGCGLAVLLHRRSTCQPFGRLAQPTVTTLLGLATITVLFWPGMVGGWLDWVLPTFVALSLPGLLISRGLFAALLETRPMRWLGRVSYGIYLLHQLTLHLADRIVPNDGSLLRDTATVAVALAILLPTVAVLSTAVERPLIERGRRMSRRILAADAERAR